MNHSGVDNRYCTVTGTQRVLLLLLNNLSNLSPTKHVKFLQIVVGIVDSADLFISLLIIEHPGQLNKLVVLLSSKRWLAAPVRSRPGAKVSQKEFFFSERLVLSVSRV